MFYKGREFCLGYLDADQYYYENEDTDNTSIPSKILDYLLTSPSSNSKFKTNPSLSLVLSSVWILPLVQIFHYHL